MGLGDPSYPRGDRSSPPACAGPTGDYGEHFGSTSSTSGAMKCSRMASFCSKELSRRVFLLSSNPKLHVRFHSFFGFVTRFPAWQLREHCLLLF